MSLPIPPVRTVRFGDLASPVRFSGCDDLLDAVRSILRGWSVVDVPAGDRTPPVIRVRRVEGGYRRVSRWTDRPSRVRAKLRRTLVEALCGFHSEFLDGYVEAHPDHLFIHGAAAMYGRRLVLFPAAAHAGKSTLTVHLAAAGRRIFCDDVLPIHPRTHRGIALGIVPRLRPPLPDNVSDEVRRFVDARAGHGYRNRLYVSLRGRELAPLGASAPIGGVVLLERRPTGPARLTDVDPADALETVILQNFARDVPAMAILDTLDRVVRKARCFRLRYSRTADAVAVLEDRFGAPKARRAARGPRA